MLWSLGHGCNRQWALSQQWVCLEVRTLQSGWWEWSCLQISWREWLAAELFCFWLPMTSKSANAERWKPLLLLVKKLRVCLDIDCYSSQENEPKNSAIRNQLDNNWSWLPWRIMSLRQGVILRERVSHWLSVLVVIRLKLITLEKIIKSHLLYLCNKNT